MPKPETPSRNTARNTSSKISNTTTRKKQENGGLQHVLLTHKHELAGLLIMLVSLLLLISIFSYSPQDSSTIENLTAFEFFTESARFAADKLQNPLGLIGAKLSEFIIKSILGYPTALLVGVSCFWGWIIFRAKKPEPAISATVYAVLFAVQIAAMFGGTHFEISEVMSGAIGRLIGTFLHTVIGDFGAWSILVISLMVTLALMINLDVQKTVERIRTIFQNKTAGESARVKVRHEAPPASSEKNTDERFSSPSSALQQAASSDLPMPSAAPRRSQDDENQYNPALQQTQDANSAKPAQSTATEADDDVDISEHLSKGIPSYVEELPAEKDAESAPPPEPALNQTSETPPEVQASEVASTENPPPAAQKRPKPEEDTLKITVHSSSGQAQDVSVPNSINKAPDAGDASPSNRLTRRQRLRQARMMGEKYDDVQVPSSTTPQESEEYVSTPTRSEDNAEQDVTQEQQTSGPLSQQAPEAMAPPTEPSTQGLARQSGDDFEQLSDEETIDALISPYTKNPSKETAQEPAEETSTEAEDEETIDALISPYTKNPSKKAAQEPAEETMAEADATPKSNEPIELEETTAPKVAAVSKSEETSAPAEPSKSEEKSARVAPNKAKEKSAPKPSNADKTEENLSVEITVKKRVYEAQADLDDRDLKVETQQHVQYRFPSVDLLNEPENEESTVSLEELEENKAKLLEKLRIYKIEVIKIEATVGPRVTLFELELAPDVKVSRIVALQDDLAMALAARGIRIIAPIPGKNAVGVEIPNSMPQMVHIKTMLQSEKFKNSKFTLPIAFGKTISNEIFIDDLAKMPHLLIAGATGSGKSVGINTLLASLIYFCSPDRVKFLLIDPKRVELFPYHQLKNHFLVKYPELEEQIITDTSKAVYALKSIEKEMDNRYDRLAKGGVRNIKAYNEKFSEETLPYIVVVIDELADMMITAGKEVEEPIARLAQLARAVGIHLVVATQRPSVDVITGMIKANFPARVAYQVTSKVDSRTILDMMGAEQLLGNGDMLYLPSSEPKPIRLQNAFISTSEVERLTDFIYSQTGFNAYYELPVPEIKSTSGRGSRAEDGVDTSRDKMFEEAARLVVRHQQGSVSLLQRRLKLGFSRAARIMDQLEMCGIVGPQDGSKARVVLVETDDSLELLLNNLEE